MGSRSAASAKGTPATVALTAAGVPFALHAYRHDPASGSFGLEAAEALGVEPARVFKTLMIRLEPEEFALALVPVDRQLDLKATAAALGVKRAALAEPAAVERRSGYVLGGVSPFGQRRPHRLVADASVLAASTVFVSGGRRGLEIEIAGPDLLAATDGTTAGLGG
ncbi:Cys-tRNA(Pro) deacylase [Zhihengliuella sp.]|uniref:Cys-tRNA(Pro) deacylase n=1 Tax=Zhihengliuella sp. TaxID=1954483 RepID=UPI0028120364|nr:Cys-tRNA(Pro) deacylase [Zhihengliuella sp.]